MCMEGLPHPGLDCIGRRVRERLAAAGVPVVHHECTPSERASPGGLAPFAATLRTVLALRSMSGERHVFLGHSCMDMCHLAAAGTLHAETRRQSLLAVGAADRKVVAVHLDCDVHDCFERICSSVPAATMTLDDLEGCQRAVQTSLSGARSVLTVRCPPYFEDDERFARQTVEAACTFFLRAVDDANAEQSSFL